MLFIVIAKCAIKGDFLALEEVCAVLSAILVITVVSLLLFLVFV